MSSNLKDQTRNSYDYLEKTISDLTKIKQELEKCIAEIEVLFPYDDKLLKAHKHSLDLLERQFESHAESLRSLKETASTTPKIKQQITVS